MFDTKKLAKHIVENSYLDRENETLFITNPGISFDTLKSLSKKHNFSIGQTSSGEYISIPVSYKYTGEDKNLSLYDDFLATYTYYDNTYNTLLTAYKTFDLMAENQAEVDLMLDTYAAEVLSQGFVDNPLKITISNQRAQSLIEKVLYKNKIYQYLPNIVKSLAKYGNYGMILQYPYLEDMQHHSKEIDFKRIDVLEDLVITLVNPKYFQVNTDEYYNVINYVTEEQNILKKKQTLSTKVQKIWQPWQFCHLLIPSEETRPYGKSMLWAMRSSFDQLTTLEALLAISRASKIQRLVFTVPMPNGINLIDSYGYLNEFRAQYLNSVFADMGTTKAGRKIPGAMSILTLPESYDGKKVTVDHIESNIDLSSVEDVQYFLDKILRNSALPKGYLVGEDTITTAQTLEAQDLKLRRTLIPLKKALLDGMMVLIENILTHAGYDVSRIDVEVSINEPIQVPAEIIEKYGSIIELLGGFINLNKDMPDINKFQFLIKLGLPADLAALACSKTSMNALSNTDELGRFLIGQKLKTPGMSATEEPDLEETTKFSVDSRQFLKENYELSKQLHDFYDNMRLSTDKVLKESLLTAKKETLNG